MAQKYQYVEELAGNALKELTNRNSWFKYLKTAANHYKYSFRDSLLIYAQKPEASAVASFDLWNNVMHRYINKGTNGIALIDRNGSRPGLRYVFDIADTHGEKLPYIWQYKEDYADRINQELKDSFEVEGDLGDFDTIIGVAAASIIEDNLPELLSELKYSKNNSFLEEFDDMNLEMILKNMLYESVVTTVFLRCGYDINIDDEGNYEFSQLYNFNTPDTMILLGTATSDISETLLREIELSVKTIEREQLINERGIQYGNRLQGRERTYVPGVGSQGADRRTADEIRTDEEELSGAELPDTVQQYDPEGGIVQPQQRERTGSETADEHQDRPDETSDRAGQMADDERGDREYIDQGDSSGGVNDEGIPEIAIEKEGADEAPFSSGKIEQIPEEDIQPNQKKRKTQAQNNFSKLETLVPHIMDKRYRYAKLTADGFMDLSIEWVGADRVAMSHYGEQNGNLIADPDMELIIDFNKKEILPATFQNDYVGVYQEVYSGNNQWKPELSRVSTAL